MAEYQIPQADPAYGDALDALAQQLVRGLSGLDGRYVRPRWQPTAPATPAIDVNWAAVAVQTITPDSGVVVRYREFIRHEELEVRVTMYGPEAMRYAQRVKNGVMVPANTAVMQAHGLYYRDATDIVAAPELINDQWLKRYDFALMLRRMIRLDYGTDTIQAANAIIYNDTGLDPQTLEVHDNE